MLLWFCSRCGFWGAMRVARRYSPLSNAAQLSRGAEILFFFFYPPWTRHMHMPYWA